MHEDNVEKKENETHGCHGSTWELHKRSEVIIGYIITNSIIVNCEVCEVEHKKEKAAAVYGELRKQLNYSFFLCITHPLPHCQLCYCCSSLKAKIDEQYLIKSSTKTDV